MMLRVYNQVLFQELLVPMNDDLNIYDGRTIEGSSEAKSRSSWVEMFDMMDLAITNLQQQNKDLKRQVNELNSKLNKVGKCLNAYCHMIFSLVV